MMEESKVAKIRGRLNPLFSGKHGVLRQRKVLRAQAKASTYKCMFQIRHYSFEENRSWIAPHGRPKQAQAGFSGSLLFPPGIGVQGSVSTSTCGGRHTSGFHPIRAIWP
jgi:hypothetical protein